MWNGIFLQQSHNSAHIPTTEINENLYLLSQSSTVWKVSKYGVFSGPHFPTFGQNTERYSISLRIQSEYGKKRTRKNSVFGHFSRSVRNIHKWITVLNDFHFLLIYFQCSSCCRKKIRCKNKWHWECSSNTFVGDTTRFHISSYFIQYPEVAYQRCS